MLKEATTSSRHYLSAVVVGGVAIVSTERRVVSIGEGCWNRKCAGWDGGREGVELV
jgi:hypothetical protein